MGALFAPIEVEGSAVGLQRCAQFIHSFIVDEWARGPISMIY